MWLTVEKENTSCIIELKAILVANDSSNFCLVAFKEHNAYIVTSINNLSTRKKECATQSETFFAVQLPWRRNRPPKYNELDAKCVCVCTRKGFLPSARDEKKSAASINISKGHIIWWHMRYGPFATSEMNASFRSLSIADVCVFARALFSLPPVFTCQFMLLKWVRVDGDIIETQFHVINGTKLLSDIAIMKSKSVWFFYCVWVRERARLVCLHLLCVVGITFVIQSVAPVKIIECHNTLMHIQMPSFWDYYFHRYSHCLNFYLHLSFYLFLSLSRAAYLLNARSFFFHVCKNRMQFS